MRASDDVRRVGDPVGLLESRGTVTAGPRGLYRGATARSRGDSDENAIPVRDRESELAFRPHRI